MYLQLTNAAVAALQANPALQPKFFQLGSATGYVPEPTQTGLHGTIVYTADLSEESIINGNVVRYSILLPTDVGPFNFGEVGLFTDDGHGNSFLFAIGVTDVVIDKTIDYQFRLDGYVSSVNANYQSWLDLAETSNAYHMGILQSVDQLPSGANAVPSAFIIKQTSQIETFRAFNSGQGLWGFDEYILGSTFTVVSATVNSVTLALVSYTGPDIVNASAPTILEFTSGSCFSVCRYIDIIVLSGQDITLNWETPTLEIPVPGDTFCIFTPRLITLIAGSGILLSEGADGSVTITGVATGAGLTYGNFIPAEVPGGTKNGINTAFTLANSPHLNSAKVYVNGLKQTPAVDYTVTSNLIQFVVPPLSTDTILADYMV